MKASYILPSFILVAEIFNQLNNPVLVWKSAFKHHHCVLLLHPTDLYIVAMSDLWYSRLVTPKALCGAHRRGRTKTSLVTGPPAGAGSSCLEKMPGTGSSPRTGWKEPESQVLAMGCTAPALSARTLGLVLEMIPHRGCAKGLADGGVESPQGFPQPGTSVHGANWGCKTGMEPPDCVTTCVALSKATQDMLQTPWSSHPNPSLWNCCMQIPTLSMAIKTRNGLHLFPLNTDTYRSLKKKYH